MYSDTKPTLDTSKIGQGRKPVLPMPGTKWPQSAVHYQETVAPGGCDQCNFYDVTRARCAVVAGFISGPRGVCDFFDDPNHPPPPVTKFQSGYVEVKKPGNRFQCATCAFFDPGNEGCQIVEGKINPNGVCWEWADSGQDPQQSSDESTAADVDAITSGPALKSTPGKPS